jgi:hypothetical protein
MDWLVQVVLPDNLSSLSISILCKYHHKISPLRKASSVTMDLFQIVDYAEQLPLNIHLLL